MYTAVSLSVERLIASTGACIATQKEDSKHSYIRSAVAISQTQQIYLLKERDRPLFLIFKNLNSYYNV
jgi:hypothetical protein